MSGIVPIERSIGVPHPTLWPPAGHECIEATWPRMRPAHAFSRRQTGRQLKAMKPEVFFFKIFPLVEKNSIMILPQVHLRKPCYDFYFL